MPKCSRVFLTLARLIRGDPIGFNLEKQSRSRRSERSAIDFDAIFCVRVCVRPVRRRVRATPHRPGRAESALRRVRYRRFLLPVSSLVFSFLHHYRSSAFLFVPCIAPDTRSNVADWKKRAAEGMGGGGFTEFVLSRNCSFIIFFLEDSLSDLEELGGGTRAEGWPLNFRGKKGRKCALRWMPQRSLSVCVCVCVWVCECVFVPSSSSYLSHKRGEIFF